MKARVHIHVVFVLVVLFLFLFSAYSVSEAQRSSNRKGGLEPKYQEKLKSIKSDDLQGCLDLAQWCKDQGYIREMLHSLDKVLLRDKLNKTAHKSLFLKAGVAGENEKKGKKKLEFDYPAPLQGKTFDLSLKKVNPSLAVKARKQQLKQAAKTVRFTFFSDLEREKLQEYVQLLNPYYFETRNFFRINKNEVGVQVLIFSKRSDYLQFYASTQGKSGEHSLGFFRYNNNFSMLCFNDDPDNLDQVHNTAKHECTHLLVKSCMQGAEMAIWLNEGFACFFAGNGLDWRGGYPAGCYLNLWENQVKNTSISLETLMETPQDDFDYDYYASAWAWVSYFYQNQETKDRMARLFFALRKKARDPDYKDWESDDWLEETNRLFSEMMGKPEKFQGDYDQFLKDQLAPKTPIQLYYCAMEALSGVLNADKDEALSFKVELLYKGEEWMRRASESEDKKFSSLAKLLYPIAILARSKIYGYKSREATYAAALAERKLDAFILDPANEDLAEYAGREAYRILCILWRASGVKEDSEVKACDYLSIMKEKEDELLKDIKQARKHSKTKSELSEELAFHQLQTKILSNLIVQAKTAFRLTLHQDETKRKAVFDWLKFAMDFYPQDLETLFPYLQFQAEVDPDDISLAALASAYAGMGRVEFAQALLNKACAISANKNNLKYYIHYVNK